VQTCALPISLGAHFRAQEQVEALAGLPVDAGVGHVPGAVAQRLAPGRAALLLAVGIGVVGADAEALGDLPAAGKLGALDHRLVEDRKSTRLNSSHVKISYAVFCLKK